MKKSIYIIMFLVLVSFTYAAHSYNFYTNCEGANNVPVQNMTIGKNWSSINNYVYSTTQAFGGSSSCYGANNGNKMEIGDYGKLWNNESFSCKWYVYSPNYNSFNVYFRAKALESTIVLGLSNDIVYYKSPDYPKIDDFTRNEWWVVGMQYNSSATTDQEYSFYAWQTDGGDGNNVTKVESVTDLGATNISFRTYTGGGNYYDNIGCWNGSFTEEPSTVISSPNISINTVRITPSDASITTDLNGYCKATEKTGHNVTFNYTWYRNGVYSSSGTSLSKLSGVDSLVNTTLSPHNISDDYIFSCKAFKGDNETNWLNSSTLSISGFAIDNCSLYSQLALNFSIYEENNLTPLTVDVVGVFTYNLSDTEKNFTLDIKNVNNFQICITPKTLESNLDAYLQYGQSGVITERYYIENIPFSNVSKNVNLYNFDTTTGLSELAVTSYNYYYAYYPNIIGKLQRYYPNENAWITVQIDRTDTTGQLLFYIYQNTVDYKIVWEDINGEIDRTDALKFICDSATECESSFTVEAGESQSNYEGMTYYDTYNNETGIYSFTWSDTNNLVTSVNLIVDQLKADKITNICDETVSSSSGTIVCNTSGYTGVLSVRAVRTASPEDWFYSNIIEVIVDGIETILANAGRSNDGLILGSFISLAFIGGAAATGSVVGVIIITIITLIITSFLSLGSVLNYTVLATITVLGIIVAYMVNK